MIIDKNNIHPQNSPGFDEKNLTELSTQIIEENKLFELTFSWDGKSIETKKELFIDDENHQIEAQSLLKIIDALFASITPVFKNNGCILHEIDVENLEEALRFYPLLEMSSLFLKAKDSDFQENKPYEFSYTTYSATINSTKVMIVKSTMEDALIPAPIVLYLTVGYLKNIYHLNSEDEIRHFIDYLKKIR